jgi:hypothetical protein
MIRPLRFIFLAGLLALLFSACGSEGKKPPMDLQYLVSAQFGADSQWYKDNIPFFECSDRQIQEVYYYRWKLYKAHIRNVGQDEYVITEFINHVPWDRDPQCTINAASMHHIYEGRWLRDDRYVNGYIDYLFQKGGNNRRYSESVADAAYANFLVNVDTAFLTRQLDSMMAIYAAWSDHYDHEKELYHIAAMPDATEYNIASIDASGGKDGFEGGDAFRPTINSYMYANANAISHVAKLAGREDTAYQFSRIALNLKRAVMQGLWNDSMQHFVDRFKQNNQFVRYWDFIRGRELAGFAPWYFNLPEDSVKFHQAWKHIIDTSHLLGAYGLRTNEPSYEYYFKQFVWFDSARGSQWNGPSWPYQTSQALTGMANMLNDYKQKVITPSDYLKILRQYTRQHYLPDGKINLVENYDPNLGGPIVHYYWSNHYLHSSFNNLVITGLCGIRPSEDQKLVINPLLDSSIRYFYLDNVNYHGHRLTLAYDRDGSRYKLGKGLMIWVDGKRKELQQENGKQYLDIGKPVKKKKTRSPANHALNIARKGYPVPSSSIYAASDSSLYQAIDGRSWYFTEITNYWSTRGSKTDHDSYKLDFGQERAVTAIKIYFLVNGREFFLPKYISVDYENPYLGWMPATKPINQQQLQANTPFVISFDSIPARGIRIGFTHPKGQVAITEVEVY